MKLTINKEDIRQYKEKYGNRNATAAYAEQFKILRIPLPKFYILVLDDEALTLIQLSLKLEEKNTERIPVSDILKVKTMGFPFNRVDIETKNKVFKLVVRPYILGIKEEQKEFLDRLSSKFS